MSSKNQNLQRVLCVGEAMLELSFNATPDKSSDASAKDNPKNNNSSASVKYAGDTLNTAVYLQRLIGKDATVAYCTVVGQDPLSGRLIDFIKSENIDVTSIQQIDNRTIGLYAINTDNTGERSFTYWRNESAARTLFQKDGKADFSVLKNFDVIYMSAITIAILPARIRKALLEELTSLRNENRVKFAFDSNYRPALWESQSTARETIASYWSITDIALPSVDDEQALFADQNEQALISRLQSYGIEQGALKRGPIGPISLTEPEISLSTQELPTVDVVDTTAAGDSFNAGYLSAILSMASEKEALVAGHQCASRVITYQGAIIPPDEW